MTERFLDPTQNSGKALLSRNIPGEVVMLNLMRFKEVADYSQHPDLAPEKPISGRDAYQKYMAHTSPLLEARGGKVLYLGVGGAYFIGPEDEVWDLAILVQHASIGAFMAFADDPEFLAGFGHRAAALVDSRLLPLVGLTD